MKKKVVSFAPIECTSFMDKDGNPTEDFPHYVPSEHIALWYKAMTLARVFSDRMTKLQRTGGVGTNASCEGQEAVCVGFASAMRPQDILLATYREFPAQMVRAATPEEVMKKTLLYWGGDERGSSLEGAAHDFPPCVPIATQTTHAVGAAVPGSGRVAVCVLGDGASSKGDFYEAMNFAGTGNLPVVFLVINNQWAISHPRKEQTAAPTLAQKGIAAGIKHCIQVDGNDVVAVYVETCAALERARSKRGPTLIEAVTYRLGDHTTADDARRYRSDEEVERARAEEPLRRVRAYLERGQMWGDKMEEELLGECKVRVEKCVEEYLDTLKKSPRTVDDMFSHLHATLPDALKSQLEEARRFAKKGGA